MNTNVRFKYGHKRPGHKRQGHKSQGPYVKITNVQVTNVRVTIVLTTKTRILIPPQQFTAVFITIYGYIVLK